MEICETERERNMDAIARRLKLYRTYQSMLAVCGSVPMLGCDCGRAERAMEALTQEVRALPLGRERLILELHYFEGNSIEGCAELMGISRSTAFRIHRRALEMLDFRERVRELHA